MDTSSDTSAAAAAATYKVAITEQHSGRILLFDRTAQWTDANVRWSFSTGNAPGWDHPFEIRFRDTQRYGMIALMTFGRPGEGRAAIVNVTGKAHLTRADVLWSARITSYPHCVERVPGTGTVVVAGSRDRLHVFGPSSSDPATLKEVQTLEFTKAHAVLWDDQNGLLWVTGGTVVRSYRVTGTMRAARLVKQGPDIAIAGNGHDLQPDYGRPGTCWSPTATTSTPSTRRPARSPRWSRCRTRSPMCATKAGRACGPPTRRGRLRLGRPHRALLRGRRPHPRRRPDLQGPPVHHPVPLTPETASPPPGGPGPGGRVRDRSRTGENLG